MIEGIGSKKSFIRLRCNDCGAVREVRRNTKMLESEDHPCRSCSNKRNGPLRAGKYSAWNSGMKKPQSERKLGGIYINHDGYQEMWLGDDSILYGRKDGYVTIHRKVAQDTIGRPLDSSEIVHHVDGNKVNNSPENLLVCKNVSKHREVHNQLEEIAFYLVQNGIICFDPQRGYYIAPHISNGMVEPGEFRERLRPTSYGNPEPSPS